MSKASTRPNSSPSRAPESVVAAVLVLRKRLVEEGKDAGALSIRDRMVRDGFQPLVSASTISRVLDSHHLTERNHRKRPKRSHKRFVAEYVNERWQSDAFEMTLSSGLAVVIVEIIDDCTRFNIGEHPGPAETSEVVLEAFRVAIERYGRPVSVHTDNGAAFNRDRYNVVTRLKAFLNTLGIATITGRPGHPKSQGKVERAHQTIIRFIKAHDPHTLEELAVVLEKYRDWYNHDRSHQSLPPNTSPGEAYASWPKIAPPANPLTPGDKVAAPNRRSTRNAVFTRTVNQHGRFKRNGRLIGLGKRWSGQQIHVVIDQGHMQIFDSAGTHLITTPWPLPPGGAGLARQIRSLQPPEPPSTMS